MTPQYRPQKLDRGMPSDPRDSMTVPGPAPACRHTAARSMRTVALIVRRTSSPTVGRAPLTAPDSWSSSRVSRPSSTNVAPHTRPIANDKVPMSAVSTPWRLTHRNG